MVTLVKGISKLPFPILYLLSDFLNFILFTIIGYRKDVIVTNLKKSFPEKSEQEIKKITKVFCGYLCDLILEGIKTYSMTQKDIVERVRITNLEVVNNWHDKNSSVIIVLGHYGNWEYGALRYSVDSKHTVKVVYKPLTNKKFDQFMRDARSKFGSECVPMRETYRTLEEDLAENKLFALGLVGDQAPAPEKGYWMEFLNQDTPVFLGCERIAKKYNLPIIFAHIDKTKRGFYDLTFKNISTDPASSKDGEITELHTKILEEAIKMKPEIWVWSHKRWKHKTIPESITDEQISTNYPPVQKRN